MQMPVNSEREKKGLSEARRDDNECILIDDTSDEDVCTTLSAADPTVH